MAQKAAKPVPEGMNTLTTHLWFNGDCDKAIEFYQRALGAELSGPPVPGPGGKGVMHAMMRLGDTNFMLADAWPGNWEQGPEINSTASLWVYVEDCDALYNRALKAGCEVVEEMMDAFWGDRNGKVKDPFGHCWSIATQKWVLTPQEMEQRMQEWLKNMR